MKLTEVAPVSYGPYGYDNDELAISHHFLRHCVKGRWTLIGKDLVNVEGDVRVPDIYPSAEIPVQFHEVSGNFTMANAVKIKSLVGCPRKVGGYFNCDHTSILQLHGGPQWVGGSYFAGHTKINTLAGAPKYIGEHFNVSHNEHLASIVGIPEHIGGNFIAVRARFKSFADIHRQLKMLGGGVFKFHNDDVVYLNRDNSRNPSNQPLPTNILGLLMINGIQKIEFKGPWDTSGVYEKIQVLFDEYLKKKNIEELIDIQHKLIDMGLAAQAKM